MYKPCAAVRLTLTLVTTTVISGCALIPAAYPVGAAISVGALVSDRAFLSQAKELPPGHKHDEQPPITLELVLPVEVAEEAWNRAILWIGRYAPQGFSTLTETLIETADPPPVLYRMFGPFGQSEGSPGTFYYSVAREKRDGAVTFVVRCAPGDVVVQKETWSDEERRKFGTWYRRKIYDALADRNAHTVAWFIVKGELYEPRIYPHGPFRTYGPHDPKLLSR